VIRINNFPSGRGERGGGVAFDEGFDARPDFGGGEVPQAFGGGKAAVIGAGPVGAGFTFHPFRRGMQRGEPFGQGGSVEGEGGDAGDGGEVAGAGAVADEQSGLIEEGEELADGAGTGHGGLPGLLPPSELVGVANNLDIMTVRPEAADQVLIMIQGPDAGGQTGASVHHDLFHGRAREGREIFAQRQVEAQGLAGGPPVIIVMGQGVGAGDWLGEKNAAVEAGEAEPAADAGGAQHKMVTGIPTAGEAVIKVFGGESLPEAPHIEEGPAPDLIFLFKGGPGGGKGEDFYVGPEAGLQFQGDGFGEEADREFFTGGAQKGGGDDEVAHAPKLDDEEPGFAGGGKAPVNGGRRRVHR